MHETIHYSYRGVAGNRGRHPGTHNGQAATETTPICLDDSGHQTNTSGNLSNVLMFGSHWEDVCLADTTGSEEISQKYGEMHFRQSQKEQHR